MNDGVTIMGVNGVTIRGVNGVTIMGVNGVTISPPKLGGVRGGLNKRIHSGALACSDPS